MHAASEGDVPVAAHGYVKSEVLATFKFTLTAGAGLYADGYDLAVINLGLAMLSHLYPNEFSASVKGAIVSLTNVGVIFGQIGFGVLADVVGRKVASVVTGFLTVVGAVLSGCVVDTPGFPISMQLLTCRIFLGLGIGGEYPLSAALAKEMDTTGISLGRTKMLCLNCALFHCGAITQSLVVLFLIGCQVPIEVVWRVSFMLGAVPAALALYLRLFIEEPAPHDPSEDVVSSSTGGSDMPVTRPRRRTHVGFGAMFVKVVGPRFTVLVGACCGWFFYNLTSWGLLSFASVIVETLFHMSTSYANLNTIIVHDAVFAFLLGAFMLVGVSIGTINEHKVSRRTLAALGFSGTAFLLLLCGILVPYQHQVSWVLAFMIVLSQVFYAFLALATYTISSEAFPSSVRGTCVGLSSASGKIGAAIGTGLFPVGVASFGLGSTLVICGLLMVIGLLTVFLFIPSPLDGLPVNICGSRDRDEEDGKDA